MHEPTNYNMNGVFEPSDLDEMWRELRRNGAAGEREATRNLRAKTIIQMRMVPDISRRAEASESKDSLIAVKGRRNSSCPGAGWDSGRGQFAESRSERNDAAE